MFLWLLDFFFFYCWAKCAFNSYLLYFYLTFLLYFRRISTWSGLLLMSEMEMIFLKRTQSFKKKTSFIRLSDFYACSFFVCTYFWDFLNKLQSISKYSYSLIIYVIYYLLLLTCIKVYVYRNLENSWSEVLLLFFLEAPLFFFIFPFYRNLLSIPIKVIKSYKFVIAPILSLILVLRVPGWT